MSNVFRCEDCGHIFRFDKNGDGKCNECGASTEKVSEADLCDDDKVTLEEADEEEGDSPNEIADLDHSNKDILE